MTLNELIAKLQQQADAGRGDFKVTTWDGIVREVRFDCACDGVVNVDPATYNEISFDLVHD
jgi:hypothetical protein